MLATPSSIVRMALARHVRPAPHVPVGTDSSITEEGVTRKRFWEVLMDSRERKRSRERERKMRRGAKRRLKRAMERGGEEEGMGRYSGEGGMLLRIPGEQRAPLNNCLG